MRASPRPSTAARRWVTEGALVGEGQATPLTVVQQIDPIYVNFAQPAAEVLRLKQIRDGQLQGIEPDKLRVRLLLPDGTEYARTGALSFADLAVDPGTDNVTMRALFDNPRRVPARHVRARAPGTGHQPRRLPGAARRAAARRLRRMCLWPARTVNCRPSP